MSLSKPHPLWTTCSNNSYECSKAILQAKIVSGRYKTDRLARHFGQNNDGNCRICNENADGSMVLLLHCPSLATTRQKMFHLLHERNNYCASTRHLINSIMGGPSESDKVQLLLDCSCLPDIISSHLSDNRTMLEIFRFTRTWCFAVHSMRLKIEKDKERIA